MKRVTTGLPWRWFAGCLGILIFVGVPEAWTQNRERVLDRFDFDGDAAARAVWQARESTPPVRTASDGGLFFDCPFGRRSEDRFYWDRKVTLDLSGETVLTLDMEVLHPEAFRSFALYLQSGDGWYIWSRPLTETGRQRLTLYRDDFETEGTPVGWDRIETLRISPWRGARGMDTRLRIYGLRASTPSILLIRATDSAPNDGERAAARRATRPNSG